jgi:hypothetical protein
VALIQSKYTPRKRSGAVQSLTLHRARREIDMSIVPQAPEQYTEMLTLVIEQEAARRMVGEPNENTRNNIQAVTNIAVERIKRHMGDAPRQRSVLRNALDTVNLAGGKRNG